MGGAAYHSSRPTGDGSSGASKTEAHAFKDTDRGGHALAPVVHLPADGYLPSLSGCGGMGVVGRASNRSTPVAKGVACEKCWLQACLVPLGCAAAADPHCDHIRVADVT